MRYKITYFFMFIISCPLYGGLENFENNIHKDVVDIAKITWKWNNPFLIAGLKADQIQQQMPQWLRQSDNLAQSARYIGTNIFLWCLPFMMELAKPTFVHWVSKLKKKEIPPAPVPAPPQDGEENRRNEEQNKEDKVKRQQPTNVLDKQTVFVEIARESIVTSETLWLPFYTLVRSAVQHTALEHNNNQPRSQVALAVVTDAGIAGAADITYNTIMLILKKIVATLEIQNPFDRDASWYKDVQSIAPVMIKAAIMFVYQSQAAVLINSIKQNNN